MSREIKFRLILCMRIVGYEKWFCGVFTENDGAEADPKWLYSKDNKRWFPELIFHAQKDQFTGLLDENGKEIYEGDIVRMTIRENIGTFNVPDDIIANGGYTGREDVYEGEVIYEINVTGFGIDDKKNGFIQLMFEKDMWLEVLGNIYENPELIKDKEESQ